MRIVRSRKHKIEISPINSWREEDEHKDLVGWWYCKSSVKIWSATSILDYCNSLLYSISDSLLQRLQSVKNAAARLVTGTRRSDHITPVLRQLHWLPIRHRNRFKIAGCVFQALTVQTPAYLAVADDCHLISDLDRRKFSSSDIRTCVTPPPNVYEIGWQKFFSCWSSSLEQSTICTPDSGLDVWPFQTRT